MLLDRSRGYEIAYKHSPGKGWIGRLAWSPDGGRLAAVSDSRGIVLWDATRRAHRTLAHTEGDCGVAIAWSPDGSQIAYARAGQLCIAGSESGEVLVTGKLDSSSLVQWVAFAPHGPSVAVAGRTLALHDARTGAQVRVLQGSTAQINCVAWSPDGTRLAGASDDGIIYLWEAETGSLLAKLEGHTGGVTSLAWREGAGVLVSGGDDMTVRLWEPNSGAQLSTFEGHTAVVTGIDLSADGRFIASVGWDDHLCLWSREDGSLLARWEAEHDPDSNWQGVAFRPDGQELAALGADDSEIRLWDLSAVAALPAFTQVRYATAKIVLVGDSGVGKTGLGWRLAKKEFREHSSTHGQQFWGLDDLELDQEEGVSREAVLWDLAGQPDYRLIHTLFLSDADVALVLFDPCDRRDPLKGVEYWLNALRRNRERRCKVILVGARVDRGTPDLTEFELDAFCHQHGIEGGWVLTSALAGEGLPALKERIRKTIDWGRVPAVVSTQAFKTIKDCVLSLKSRADQRRDTDGYRSGLILSESRLQEEIARLCGASLTAEQAEILAAVKSLEHHGYVQVLRGSHGERYILLEANLLNNLAASFILAARANRKGLGALDEYGVWNREYRMPELADLSKNEGDKLLDAVIALFVEAKVCLRERNYLIFPALIHARRPLETAWARVSGATYMITGAVENVYAALVVLLGYTNLFTRVDQWYNQAEYRFENGDQCGLEMVAEQEGECELRLFYSEGAKPRTKSLFQGLVETFLEGQDVTVVQYPEVICLACKYKPHHDEVKRRIRAGKSMMGCPECSRPIPLPAAAEPLQLSTKARAEVDQQEGLARLRTRFERVLARVRPATAVVTPPTCAVTRLDGWADDVFVPDLRKAGIEVLQPPLEGGGREPAAILEIASGGAEGPGPNDRFATSDALRIPVIPPQNRRGTLPRHLRGIQALDCRDPEAYYERFLRLVLMLWQATPDLEEDLLRELREEP